MSRLIVFDLDGTLIDSRRDIAEAANALLVASGANALPEETIGRMVGDGAATLVARAFSASGRKQPEDALDRFLTIYDQHLLEHTRPYPGVPEVLRELSGRAALAVLTNKPLQATVRVLAGLDLARYFSAGRVIGGDGPFPRKPNPAGLQHLMAESGAHQRSTTFVGDSLIDWQTATNAATAVCLVRYGFGFVSVPTEKLDPRPCLVDTPEDLLRVL
jgi:phosphoglycolate phosphatase